MRRVGQRQQPTITAQASGQLLAEGARMNEAMARLATSTFIPKGVYRFSTQAQANQHAQDCLARGMALMARNT